MEVWTQGSVFTRKRERKMSDTSDFPSIIANAIESLESLELDITEENIREYLSSDMFHIGDNFIGSDMIPQDIIHSAMRSRGLQ